MREPAFTETMQIGIVVRDLEATMKRYVDDYQWELIEPLHDESVTLPAETYFAGSDAA